MGRPLFYFHLSEAKVNHFERVAIFTVVENIENQLKGLKTLIAASANATTPAGSHKVTRMDEPDSNELSDDEDEKLEAVLNKAREEEVARMAQTAQAYFRKELDTVIQGS